MNRSKSVSSLAANASEVLVLLGRICNLAFPKTSVWCNWLPSKSKGCDLSPKRPNFWKLFQQINKTCAMRNTPLNDSEIWSIETSINTIASNKKTIFAQEILARTPFTTNPSRTGINQKLAIDYRLLRRNKLIIHWSIWKEILDIYTTRKLPKIKMEGEDISPFERNILSVHPSFSLDSSSEFSGSALWDIHIKIGHVTLLHFFVSLPSEASHF